MLRQMIYRPNWRQRRRTMRTLCNPRLPVPIHKHCNRSCGLIPRRSSPPIRPDGKPLHRNQRNIPDNGVEKTCRQLERTPMRTRRKSNWQGQGIGPGQRQITRSTQATAVRKPIFQCRSGFFEPNSKSWRNPIQFAAFGRLSVTRDDLPRCPADLRHSELTTDLL